MRESVSARLDGELAELELDRLEFHLRSCAECAEWAAQAEDATRLLREASFEAPETRFALPRRTRRWAVTSAAVTAAVAAAASVLAPIAMQHGPAGSQQSASGPSSGLAPAERRAFDQRLLALNSQDTLAVVAPTSDARGAVRPV